MYNLFYLTSESEIFYLIRGTRLLQVKFGLEYELTKTRNTEVGTGYCTVVIERWDLCAVLLSNSSTVLVVKILLPVLRIHDILVRIRMRGP
jgi:hypothetical protein